MHTTSRRGFLSAALALIAAPVVARLAPQHAIVSIPPRHLMTTNLPARWECQRIDRDLARAFPNIEGTLNRKSPLLQMLPDRVTIQSIEIRSHDPDRFVLDLLHELQPYESIEIS